MQFGTIIADPPWDYRAPLKAEPKEGEEDGPGFDKLTGFSSEQYTPLTTEALKALPVQDLAAKNCILLLWTTAPFVPEALKIVDAWGFEYVTQFFWLKASSEVVAPEVPPLAGPALRNTYARHGESGPIEMQGWTSGEEAFSFVPSYGVGYWSRGTVEPIIVAKMPGAPSVRSPYRSLISRRAEHSRKPNTLYELAEHYYPGPLLELFARYKREGWEQTGLELPGRSEDIHDGIRRLKGESITHASTLTPARVTDEDATLAEYKRQANEVFTRLTPTP